MGSEPTTEEPATDVVVVGGGLSGLICATRLAEKGATVCVVEARDRVGGRTWSEPMGKAVFDRGGQWIGPQQHRLAELAQSLGITTFPTFHEGRKVMDVGGRVSTYTGDIPSLGWFNLIRLQLGISTLDRFTAKVPLDKPWEHDKAHDWDSETVDTWARRLGRGQAVRETFAIAIRTIFGAEPEELSLLHFLFYLNAGGGLMSLSRIRGGAQEARFIGGAQQLSIKLAEALEGSVVLGAPVERIENLDERVTLDTTVGRFVSRFCVVALAPTLTARIHFEPQLPALREQLAQRAPMGHTSKAFLLYATPFWRAAGLSGEAVCGGGPVTFVVDNTDEDGLQPCLLAFLVGGPGREWAARSEADRRAAIIEQLVRYFGEAARTPTDFIEQDWSRERYTGGCPTSAFPTGVLTQFGDALRTPCGRIHWAGTETATEWNGYMEGAIEAGERAAAEVYARL